MTALFFLFVPNFDSNSLLLCYIFVSGSEKQANVRGNLPLPDDPSCHMCYFQTRFFRKFSEGRKNEEP